ncbi:MAG: Hsp70 family protein, partial [Deltaproteobacteria bacterium]|nr:Hsp70 family protein [Deltaproteobacteria bacterium]
GRFHLIGLPPAPRGVPQVEVAFDIDANGILNVSAKDLATNKEQRITITASSGLNKDEVEKMVKEGEQHADEDKKRKEVVETRNQLDSLVYSTEKLLNENRAKVPEADAKAVEEAVAEAKKALEQNELEPLKDAVAKVTQASHKVAEMMYKEAAASGQAAGAPGQEGAHKQGDVVDAEVVDEQK